jgi:FkbM family methyltransferase
MQVTRSDRVKALLIPLVRAYIRYFPIVAGKRSLWNRLVNPYLAWHSYKFQTFTIFGSKMSGDTQDILQQYLYYFGVWESNLTHFITRRLAPGDTFIDVGANIGYFSLLASKIVGETGRVVAIEASPRIFSALRSNIACNQARNIRVVNMAVSNRKGFLRLYRGTEYNSGLTTTREERGLEFECEVEALPLDAILSPLELETARFIKIDVEGAEWDVVAGMGRLLRSGRSDLEVMVEVSPEHLANQHKRPEDLVTLFSEAGFYAYSLENDYSSLSYLAPFTEKRPTRLCGPLHGVSDIIFSRQNSEHI